MSAAVWFHRKFLRFDGRLPRKTFFIDNLVLVLLCLAALVPAVALSAAQTLVTTALLVGMVAIVGAVFVAGNFSLLLRRFHDFNASGWWLLVYAVLSLILGGVEELSDIRHMEALKWAAMTVDYASTFAILLIPGSAGDNRFGAPIYKD